MWFAVEFGWTPDQVWELRYMEFVGFTDYFDQVKTQREEMR